MQKLSFPKRQYSVQQRREALALARRLGTVTAAAAQLGIPPHTIYCWRDLELGRRRRKRITLQPVEIVGAPAAALSVRGPGGLRVDGITLEQLAQLWRLLA
jgi:transposase-like protein